MGSRIRANPDKLYEVFVEVGRPQQEGEDPFILQKYPPDYAEQDVLNNIPKFAFPCQNNTSQVDQFAFVLTDMESMYRFGYCRHGTGANTCLCIISHLPWFEVFYKMLNFLAEILNRSENNNLLPFLKAAFEQRVPFPEEPVTIVAAQDMFNFTAPDSTSLPSIPASRNLTEYYNAVDANNMMRIFASMLHERRIIIMSRKLSRLTACIHASAALLYPMHWQHLYIPVLPAHLLDYVTAPMPYLIGVHTSLMERVEKNRMEVGDAVIVDADRNEVKSEYDDLEALPDDVSSYLKRHLKTQKLQSSMMESGDAISRAFLKALVRLIGGYRDALKFRTDGPITFDRDMFVQSRSSPTMQAFLENMLQLQIFQQFINGRLELLNAGEGFHDLFEQESIKYADSLNTQSKYVEWLSKQKRKLKAGSKEIISDMRERAGPMVNTAVHTMKEQSKKMQSKIKEINENKMSSRKVRGGVVHSRSAGSDRQRPTTVAGAKMTLSRPQRPPPPSLSADRPRTMVHKSVRSKVYSTLQVDDDHYSHDDSSVRLSYHSVDVSLMSDLDIQNIMRSASAETLSRHGLTNIESGSNGEISSTPSSEALSPSDENLTRISYVAMESGSQEVAPFAPTSSSDEDLTPSSLPDTDSKPPPLPRSIPDRHIVSDRLISSSGKPVRAAPSPPQRPSKHRPESSPQPHRPTPVPSPRRASLDRKRRQNNDTPPPLPGSEPPPLPSSESPSENPLIGFDSSGGEVSPEKPLIRFESSGSESEGVEQFDPLKQQHIQQRTESRTVVEYDISTTPALSRDKPARNSVTRSEAFRRTAVSSPVRPAYRDDNNVVAVTDLFDPLVSIASTSTTSVDSTASQSSRTNVNGTATCGIQSSSNSSLMHDWTLDHLAGGTGFSRIPTGGTLTCPISTSTCTTRSVSPITTIGFSSLHRPPPPRPALPTKLLPSSQHSTVAPSRPVTWSQRPSVQKTDVFGSLISQDLGVTAVSGTARPVTGFSASRANVATGNRGQVSTLASKFNSRPTLSAVEPLLQQKPSPQQSQWEKFD